MRGVAVVLLAIHLASVDCWAIPFPELLKAYGNLETIAGTALITDKDVSGWQASMENGLAIDAELSRPHMAMADSAGNVYIADKDAHAVRMVTPDGLIHTVAGTNEPGFDLEQGIGNQVQLWSPNGLYTFTDGTTFILDTGNNRVRRLAPDGQLTTVFHDPNPISIGRGLWVSGDQQTIFYSSASEVRRWNSNDGISVYASGFIELGNLDVDPSDGQLVVTDREGYGVYKVSEGGDRVLIAGNLTANGGGSGFPATSTGLKEVRGVAFHPEGGYLLATHDGGQVWFVDDEQMIHLLIDGDDDDSHAGDGLPLTTPGKKISEPRAVAIAPNGDLLITEHDGGYIRRVKAVRPIGVPGDFTYDGQLTVDDIDALTTVVRQGGDTARFDLSRDGVVDQSDRDIWVHDLRRTCYGDADLNGSFESPDFIQVFLSGEYEDQPLLNSTWATGDWNGDGEFGSSDFVTAFLEGAYEMGPCGQPIATAVAEPAGSWLAFIAFSSYVFLLSRRVTRSSFVA